MPTLKLRDRDAILTNEKLVFRVLGYSHPPNAYVCDLEYAPEEHFKSNEPRALRKKDQHVFYKFYEDEGWRFLSRHFPEYMIFHEMLRRKMIGVNHNDIKQVRKTDKELTNLIKINPADELMTSLNSVVRFLTANSTLLEKNFGVFGSILHGFYHPQFSDMDFVIYGQQNTFKLRETLRELYSDGSSLFKNEFATDMAAKEKQWRFKNLSLKEFIWHQRRKLIYCLFHDKESGRIIKAEFEPVKTWKEIHNDYDHDTRIVQKNWVAMYAQITDDVDAPFMPSTYKIKPLKILEGGKHASEVTRTISYLEEFRMQATVDECVYIEGNLEEVTTRTASYHQIALTYCPRYYDQVLKVTRECSR